MKLVVAFLTLWSVILGVCPAAAQDGGDEHRLVWHFPRFHVMEYVGTGVVSAVGLYIEHAVRGNPDNGLNGPILLDRVTRDAIVVRDPAARRPLGTAGDIVWQITQHAATADSLITPLVSDGLNVDVAAQMTLINWQVQATAFLVTRVTTQTVGRARPRRERCREEPEWDVICPTDHVGRDHPYHSSFFSGHTATAFAGASAFCAHHMALPLYGGGVPDALACATLLTGATFVATQRLMLDAHWFSDIAVGAITGSLIGWGLPYLLHYGWPAQVDTRVGRLTLLPTANADGGGVALTWQ